MKQAKNIFDPSLPNIEYKTVDVTTVKGLDKAESLVAKGWKVNRSTPFSVHLSREVR